MMKDKMIEIFKEHFGDVNNAVYAFAPGRVNLIGEHTDYNGGHVFPCALTLGTYAVGKKRDDIMLRLYSDNKSEDGILISGLDDLKPLNDKGWSAYIKAVIWAFKEEGLELPCGLDIAISGDIPAGAGLSSSASLEVAIGAMLRELFGFNLTNEDLAFIGKKAENDYVGMSCGIMDQFASAMGKKDHAILLDTESLEYEYVPLELKDKLIVVTNTNKEHELASSEYNQRRKECKKAFDLIREECAKNSREINSFGDLTNAEFEDVQHVLTDDVLKRRARHAVMENQRTLGALKALKSGDISKFGILMNESHESLRDDYEVSCKELDILAEAAQGIKGVYGSRMTGGGFGGCTVSIIDKNALDSFCEAVSKAYKNSVGYDCTFYTVTAGEGAFATQL